MPDKSEDLFDSNDDISKILKECAGLMEPTDYLYHHNKTTRMDAFQTEMKQVDRHMLRKAFSLTQDRQGIMVVRRSIFVLSG